VSPEPGATAAAGSSGPGGAAGGLPLGGEPAEDRPDRTAGPVELLDQRFDRDSLVPLRNAVAAHASRLGVSTEQVEHIVLAAYELASNAVRHGGGSGRLRLSADDGMIGCTVIDEGGGFRGAEQAGLIRPEPTASSGRGLWLVRCIADSVEISVDDLGTTAIARFAIR
jgi:anti-sigma regulatory factor (Ser/Thr protein kinase)